MDDATQELRDVKLEIEGQGDLTDYLGINFTYHKDGFIIMSQPQLIDQIIKDVKLMANSHLSSSPAAASKLLQRDQKDMLFNGRFHCRSLIGRLSYFDKGTRPDITYATHQCARFCEAPKEVHEKAVEYIVEYLKKTRNKVIILKPDKSKSLEVYADADFSGNWNKETSEFDASTAKSRTGFLILYAGCPIVWQSKLQTQCSLSTTEAEYIALSQALREVIPIINLLEELTFNNIDTVSSTPIVFCKAFEDNLGAM